MKKTKLFMFVVALIVGLSSITAQIQTGVFRTPTGNVDYHHFFVNSTTDAAVYINQAATSGPILRLSSGSAAANQYVKFSFENNGNLGIGTLTPAEKLSLYSSGDTKVVTQYGNGKTSGFTTGIDPGGNGMLWHASSGKYISFGTSDVERMRINYNASIDIFSIIQSGTGGYQIDTTGVFQSKGYRTKANNVNYHHFFVNSTTDAAVYINQAATSGPILRLSSGTAAANQGVKFSFENNGNLGIGTLTPAEKLSLYSSGDTKVVTQYGNGKTSGFTTGIDPGGNAMVWHASSGKYISFGTSDVERMRINYNASIDILSTIQSGTGGYQIDTTGVFQSKGYRTKANNVNYHQFTSDNTANAAVYINQAATSGPILRLSSGTAAANQGVKFSFENNGNLGIGTAAPAEKLSLYNAGNVKVVTQYGNGTGSGFTVGMDSVGNGMIWHTSNTKFIALGTSNTERIRFNYNATIDISATIQSRTGGYQIDTTGVFQSKGYRTKANNVNYHQFTSDNTANAAVYINQAATSGPILRLSSGTATANQNVKFSFENNGNMGIGTATPAEKLSLYTAGNVKVVTQYGNGTGSGFTSGMDENGNGTLWHTAAKVITLGTSNVERMRINSNGNIGIGTVSPDYKLDVVGGIRAYSVQISTAKTADFVFDENYPLRPLPEVESFIATHKHLPEVAPAGEMLEKGIDMADMQIKLLQKVEELTLYVIRQQKEIEELKRELKAKN